MSPDAGPLVLKAPLSGVVVPLDEVPDPVFAQKMVGDGISVDPVSATLLAPCDGEILQLHSAGHAVTVLAAGVEVMMHVGLDTVQLKGQGFTPRVRVGDVVRAGQPLIDFDADFVATHAKSLLTQIVITSTDRVRAMRPASGQVRAGVDTLLEVHLAVGATTAGASAGPAAVSDPIAITNATGLHARPAALIAQEARRFSADVRLRRGSSAANARSVVAIMGLEIGQGDEVHVEATGPDAANAVAAVSRLLQAGLVEEPAGTAAPAPALRVPTGDGNVLSGVPASPGVAVGRVFQFRAADVDVPERGTDPRSERRALEAALDRARTELEALQARLRSETDPAKAAIFAAHRELLDDPELLELADREIEAGRSAAFAWRSATSTHADRLAALNNPLLAARAHDLRDVGRRVLRQLAGPSAPVPPVPADAIVVAEELTPSDTAGLDRTRVRGFCTTGGGATSHAAILARSLDLPAIAGIEARVLDIPDGTLAVLDGGAGLLRVDPSPGQVEEAHQLLEQLVSRRAAERQHAHEPAATADGHRVEVAANIGSVADAQDAVAAGGEAVGLLRSEFLFLHRTTAPTEEEQTDAYSSIARTLGPTRSVIVRTLDVGGDKPLPYLPSGREENPFLGQRGIRVLLQHPELLRAQLRAILRASAQGKVSIMFPMVATLAEWHAVRAFVEEERTRLGVGPVPIGIMVEVPSAAILADRFAPLVDFFSIGTNDLAQYTLAMDRGHPRLAAQVDGLAPAVLRLVAQTVQAAHAHGRWTGVCGGLAGDPQAVPVLVGLGVDELSVPVPSIAAIKAQVRRLRLDACRQLAERALACGDASEVRALVSREPLGEV